MAKTRTQYSVINIGVNIVGYILNTVMGFVCRMIFVRTLTAEYLGINGLFSNILSMLSLAELGIGVAIVYALYKPLAEDDKPKIAALMQFYSHAYRIIGIVVAIVGLSLIPFLNIIIKEPPDIKENIYIIYIVYLFNTCLTYFFSYKSTIYTAAQRNYVQVGLSYAITTVQSLIQILFLIKTKEYYIYLGIQTLGVITFNLTISYLANRSYPYIKDKSVEPLSKNEKRSLFKNIKALTVSKISELLVYSTDNIIITYLDGLVTVGTASNYTLLSGTLSSITNQVFNGLTASVGNLNAIEDNDKQYSFFKTLQLANFFVFGWATIGIMFVSTDLVGLFFGESYVLDDKIPMILAVNYYIVTMNSSIMTYRATLGLFKYGQYILIFTAAINIASSIILGKIWGLFGVYLASAIARIFTNVWYMPYAVFKHGLKRSPLEYFKTYSLYALLLGFECVICYFLCGFVNYSYIINAILKAIICTVIPIIFFIAIFHKTYEFKYLYSVVKNYLFGIKMRIKGNSNEQ